MSSRRASLASTRSLRNEPTFTQTDMHERCYDEKSCINENVDCDHTTYSTLQINRSNNVHPPDVGFRPWLVALGGFCGQFCSIGMINVIGVFIAYYQYNQLAGLSPSTISWIGSIQSFIFSFSGLLFCRLSDMYGPRWVTGCGGILITVGMVATAFCKEYYQFVLAQGICASLGAAGLFYGPTTALSGWFYARRGLAFGVAASGASIGGIVLSSVFENLSASVSFKAAVGAMAAVLFAFSLTATVATCSRLPPTEPQFTSQWIKLYFRPFLEPVFSLYTASMFLIYLGLYVPMAYLATSAIAEGVLTAHALHIITYFNVGSFFGRVLLGLISDKVNKFTLFSIITLIAGLVSAPFWYFSHSEATIIIVAVANGFFTGGILAMFTALVAEISPTEEVGTRIGAFSGVIAFAALASLPIAGAIVGTDSNYNGLKIYGAVVLIAGAMIAASLSFRMAKEEHDSDDD
ncbi:major facilitator superfamily domain-containing protein [Lipomyces orientalis]|uniref:Major facilitator superfamily domain-containing protein n=1 Tax=Lipomyces orientalis TaxID=1233043 RepID=A0ACC3TY79_9ASCO